MRFLAPQWGQRSPPCEERATGPWQSHQASGKTSTHNAAAAAGIKNHGVSKCHTTAAMPAKNNAAKKNSPGELDPPGAGCGQAAEYRFRQAWQRIAKA